MIEILDKLKGESTSLFLEYDRDLSLFFFKSLGLVVDKLIDELPHRFDVNVHYEDFDQNRYLVEFSLFDGSQFYIEFSFSVWMNGSVSWYAISNLFRKINYTKETVISLFPMLCNYTTDDYYPY